MNLPDITPNLIIVCLLGGIAMLTAIGVVAFNSPVRSSLCLVANFFTLAFIYFSMNAELLGISQVIVYTGAIMVLFLFVIMLLNLSSDSVLSLKKFDVKPILAVPVGLALFVGIGSQLLKPMLDITSISAPNNFGTGPGWGAPQTIGRVLFTEYVWPFEIISLLLMVGVVGAILLSRRSVEE